MWTLHTIWESCDGIRKGRDKVLRSESGRVGAAGGHRRDDGASPDGHDRRQRGAGRTAPEQRRLHRASTGLTGSLGSSGGVTPALAASLAHPGPSRGCLLHSLTLGLPRTPPLRGGQPLYHERLTMRNPQCAEGRPVARAPWAGHPGGSCRHREVLGETVRGTGRPGPRLARGWGRSPSSFCRLNCSLRHLRAAQLFRGTGRRKL